ncbi:NAD(P)/FAD-dependent oxidoreductase [Hirschia litorea]|uniref:NAD(P)/FAD-dependent oxidoreductase n=1 Tax=Hirschia litorea TaxID=1199156 RepID=A0ABW2IQ45_9PROT
MSSLPVFEAECVIAGAGVVGLAIARELALAGREVLLIERNSMIGMETSARNSEVIHAGIYYAQHSLKAQCCVEGKAKLYAYLKERGIAHKNCGKLIVANTDIQTKTLIEIAQNASLNCVDNLQFMDESQTLSLEPNVRAKAALYSPTTGIIDAHAYMLSLRSEAEEGGASLVLNTCIEGASALPDGRTRLACGGVEPCFIDAPIFINAAGLGAVELAQKVENLHAAHIPKQYLVKGNYFALQGKSPFSRLIYPVPEKGGLGVHLTLDMGGQARFGPDVEWVDHIDYNVDPKRSDVFYDAIRQYWPDLPNHALQPAYAGVRPKVSAPNDPNADFMILGPETHAIEGQVHLFGIESPGLTSSLAIAEIVRARLDI